MFCKFLKKETYIYRQFRKGMNSFKYDSIRVSKIKLKSDFSFTFFLNYSALLPNKFRITLKPKNSFGLERNLLTCIVNVWFWIGLNFSAEVGFIRIGKEKMFFIKIWNGIELNYFRGQRIHLQSWRFRRSQND